MNNESDEITNLKDFVRHASLLKLRQYFIDDSIDIIPAEELDIPIYGRRMSLILIFGSSIRMLFKVQYNLNSIQKNNKAFNSDLTLKESDLMKEFCNLTAGYIKGGLMELKIIVGFSLPVSTRGFDEVFRPYYHNKNIHRDTWCLESSYSRHKVTCLSTIEILGKIDLTKIKDLALLVDSKANEGDLEIF